MKKTGPVFESFNSFVSFLNEKEEAPMDFKGFLSSNSSFLDADAKKGFDAARLAATKAPLANRGKLSAVSGEALGDLNSHIKGAIDSNNEYPDNEQVTEKTTTQVNRVIYPALINGKVNMGDSFPTAIAVSNALKDLDSAIGEGKWVDINDLLTLVNIQNLWESNTGPDDLKGKGKKWLTVKGTDYVRYTGAENQNVISSIASGIIFTDNSFAIPGRDSKIIPDLAFEKKNASKKGDKRAYRTFLLYGIGNIVQGAGDTIPDTLIKKDFSKEVVKGALKDYQVPLDGGDAMFKKGSAELNVANKAKIDKLISAALAPLAGKPESIVITGGASYEPDGQGPINKKLVVDRANAVKTYIETLYPELKGVITVNDKDFSKIQAKDVSAEYEKYRKVYLDIKGVLQGDSYTIDKETEYLVDGEIKADTVEIIQYAISMEYDLPKDKEA
jgi:outer membrane protein OmpA-like peptidoglycan-associated protein